MQKALDLFIRQMRGLGRSEATVSAYTGDIRELIKFCAQRGVFEIDEITRELVLDWLAAYRDRDLSENTVARKNAAARSWFQFCDHRGFGRVAHAAPLIRRNRDQIPRIPTVAEIEAMIATCSLREEKYTDMRDRAVLEFLWSTGCRRSEASALNLGDVQFKRDGEDGRWRATAQVHGKGRKDRLVFLSPRAADAMNRYLPLRRPVHGEYHKSAVWLSREGHRTSPTDVSTIVRKRARDAGIDWPLTAHSLRHAFATQLLQGGADLFALSRMLGHSDLTTTQIYLHMSAEQARAVHARCHPSDRAAVEGA